ncbi:hypothetical protein CYMTET_44639 [Cymbomonas tetramitiformis]|uniref:Uncharacterized protein n=1 Tax=Cymbomonas tetramitiformis TaxID=36881 RepID=A0AAE0BZT5_9CHLO|nr:hypothetical protein CYMTET_44639 [Cymbomonas tetramitiformis]
MKPFKNLSGLSFAIALIARLTAIASSAEETPTTPSSTVYEDRCSRAAAYDRAFSTWQSQFEEYVTTDLDFSEGEVIANQRAFLDKLDTLFPAYTSNVVDEMLKYTIDVDNKGVLFSTVTLNFDPAHKAGIAGRLLSIFKQREDMYEFTVNTILSSEVIENRQLLFILPIANEIALTIERDGETCTIPMVDNPGHRAVIGKFNTEIIPASYKLTFKVVCGTEEYLHSIVDDPSVSIGSRRVLNMHWSFKTPA